MKCITEKVLKKKKKKKSTLILSGSLTIVENITIFYGDDDVELNVFGCRLTYQGQTVKNACAWFSVALRPQKP